MQQPPNNYLKRTRIAPTPGGYLHLGNALSFAIAVALARENDSKLLLRIDDLDRERQDKKYVQDIFDTLNFLGIPWNEGPHDAAAFEKSYSQVHRMPLYQQALRRLADKELVFACTCSRLQFLTAGLCGCMDKKIPLSAENTAWRLITSKNQLSVKKYKSETIRADLPAGMKNFVVKKKDGFPAYQLTTVIDDLFYEVDLVVRGEDLWHSTLAQLELAAALGEERFTAITFYHHPLLVDESGKKLSKSAGATSVKYLRESGKSAADIFTVIASMVGINKNAGNWQQLYRAILLP